MQMSQVQTISFEVRDVSGQKSARVKACPVDASVGEVVPSLLEMMQLPPNDSEGNPVSHTLRRNRDGAVLLESDVVGRVIEQGEECVLQPSIDAG
jgi:hypothetical protein